MVKDEQELYKREREPGHSGMPLAAPTYAWSLQCNSTI